MQKLAECTITLDYYKIITGSYSAKTLIFKSNFVFSFESQIPCKIKIYKLEERLVVRIG